MRKFSYVALSRTMLHKYIYMYICIYIYIYNTAVLIKICRFLINVGKFYANPYEIGPSNASQGQHRRKDATE